MEQEQNERFVRIRIGSAYTVYATADTILGDWCVLAGWGYGSEEHYGVILRKSAEHVYTLVGPAFVENGDDKFGFHSYDYRLSSSLSFIGTWDVEDIMVLSWNMSQCLRNKASDEEIQRFVNTRICGWTDSTYFEKGVGEYDSTRS
jgi:hypothetical protein